MMGRRVENGPAPAIPTAVPPRPGLALSMTSARPTTAAQAMEDDSDADDLEYVSASMDDDSDVEAHV
jgi:hypothetical protein